MVLRRLNGRAAMVGSARLHGGDLGELGLKHGDDLVELVDDLSGGGLGEDGADRRRHHLRRTSGHPSQDVSEEVKPE